MRQYEINVSRVKSRERRESMEQRGLVLINTGTGKGKTTAALGTAIRAWGDGQKVLILQFIKGAWKYGELEAIAALGKINGNIEIRSMGDGFVFHNKKGNDEVFAQKKRLAEEAWETAVSEVLSDKYDLVILDEVNYAIHFGMLSVEKVAELLAKRPARLNIILTGRYAPQELIDAADTVSEIVPVKHAFEKGIRARKGIEF